MHTNGELTSEVHQRDACWNNNYFNPGTDGANCVCSGFQSRGESVRQLINLSVGIENGHSDEKGKSPSGNAAISILLG
jgi:hypothetical protein